MISGTLCHFIIKRTEIFSLPSSFLIFGCTGPLLLHTGFLWLGRAGAAPAVPSCLILVFSGYSTWTRGAGAQQLWTPASEAQAQ